VHRVHRLGPAEGEVRDVILLGQCEAFHWDSPSPGIVAPM
jgi:hypothetical protein